MKSSTFGLGLRSNNAMATRRSHVHHTSLYISLPFLHYYNVKMPKAPSAHFRIFLKTDFCPSVFKKKYASRRSVFESFSPAHTKTLRMRYVSSKWYTTSLYSKSSSVFVLPRVNEWPAFFKNLHSGERFWKDAFSVIVCTEYMWTVGETGEKKIAVFKQKRICADGAWISALRLISTNAFLAVTHVNARRAR